MSPALRQCVHEYGYAIVKACLCAGVSKPERIRQLVKEIWEGARQPQQRRKVGGSLDWLLVQVGAQITTAALVRVLKDNGLVVVPIEATRKMIDASLAECSQFKDRVTKEEKHRRRLRAALWAGADYLETKKPVAP